MVNFGSIPRFLLTQRHFGYRTAPDRACLFCTIFSSICIYRTRRHTWGKQGCYERIAHRGKMKTKKGRKQWGQRAKPDCLGADEEEAGEVAPLDGLGHPGCHGLATSSEAALVAEELFFCTHVPKIPPAWAECISQPSGYNHHEAQAFLAQYTIKPTGNWRRDNPFETQTDARLCLFHDWNRGNDETRPKLHGLFVIHINGNIA